MLILLESATENSCRELFEYYEGSLILYWSGSIFWLVLLVECCKYCL